MSTRCMQLNFAKQNLCGTMILMLPWATCPIAWAQDSSRERTHEAPQEEAKPIAHSVIRRPDPTQPQGPAPEWADPSRISVEVKPAVSLDSPASHAQTGPMTPPLPIDQLLPLQMEPRAVTPSPGKQLLQMEPRAVTPSPKRQNFSVTIGPPRPLDGGNAQAGDATNLRGRITAPTTQTWKLDESGQKTDEPATIQVLESGTQPSPRRNRAQKSR